MLVMNTRRNKNQKSKGPKKGASSAPKKSRNLSSKDKGKGKYIDHKSRYKKGDPLPSFSDEVRLNKYLSNAGICSRREADELIKMGIVTVNGKVVMEMGYKVKPDDVVKYDG